MPQYISAQSVKFIVTSYQWKNDSRSHDSDVVVLMHAEFISWLVVDWCTSCMTMHTPICQLHGYCLTNFPLKGEWASNISNAISSKHSKHIIPTILERASKPWTGTRSVLCTAATRIYTAHVSASPFINTLKTKCPWCLPGRCWWWRSQPHLGRSEI